MTHRPEGHVHTDYLTVREHERFEDRMASAIERLSDQVAYLSRRMAVLMALIAVLVFFANIFQPMLQRIFGGA